MKRCDYCQTPFEGRGRFCRTPGSSCRQKWHREHTAPGIVSAGPRQLKDGRWRIAVDYPDLPPVQNGDRVLVEKDDIPRPEPSTGDQTGRIPKDTA